MSLQQLIISSPQRQDFLNNWQSTLVDEFVFNKKNYQIETLSYADFTETVRPWTQAEGWAATKHGGLATFSNDPDGFYFLKTGGENIASIAVFSYPMLGLAYIGFYIVQPACRGQGLGLTLLEKTIQYSQQYRQIKSFGLDCLADMTPLYAKLGFKTVTQDTIWRLDQATLKPETIKTLTLQENDPLIKEVLDFDTMVFGQARTDFLINFLSKPETTVIVDIENESLQGFGAISKFEFPNQARPKAYRISPIYAKNMTSAKAILMQLIASQPGAEIFAETSGFNSEADELMQQAGFKSICTMQRMLLGNKPEQYYQNMYALSSLASG